MPYLDHENRERVFSEGPSKAGDLNYLVTRLMIRALKMAKDKNGGRISYGMIRDVLADAEEAASEFRRRLLTPYEITKCQANGDPYEELL